MFITEIINSISVITAALSFIYGINAWRHEYIGKKKIELIEEVLAKFYQAEDIIKEIRSPWSNSDEGSSRSKNDGEREEDTALLNKAYIVIERYKKRDAFFSELFALKYRFMSVFGQDSGSSFFELNSVLKEIFGASYILGTYYWQRQGRVQMEEDEFKKHLDEMHKNEAIFWDMGEKHDEIGPRVRSAVEKIENIAKNSYGRDKNFFINAKAWLSQNIKTLLTWT